MAGISFSGQQFIKQELIGIAGEIQESFMSENVKYKIPLNGEYDLDLNSPEFDLENIATESSITYEQGDVLSISKTKEVQPIINVEKDINIENVDAKINKARDSARNYEHFDLRKIKSNLKEKGNTSYNLKELKIKSMPIESMDTEDNLIIKEEEIISNITHSSNSNALQKQNVRFSVSSKPCNDRTVKKNKSLKRKSDKSRKTNVHKAVTTAVPQEFTDVGLCIPKMGTSEFECSYCSYKCKYEAIFQDHMLSHQNYTFHKYLPFACDICNFQSKSKLRYDLHMTAGHNDKMLECFKCNYKNTCPVQFKLHLSENGHTIKCPKCDLDFDSNIDMKKHLTDHEFKMYECKKCNKIMKHNYVKRHLLTHAKTFECKVCGYAATSSNQLYNHMLIHTDEKPYECHVCKKTFRQECNLKRHIPSHQKRESRVLYECSVCKKSFTLKQTLKQHYKKTNHGENVLPLDLEYGNILPLESGDISLHFKKVSTDLLVMSGPTHPTT